MRLPDTIIYEHNYPRSWLYFDGKSQELKRHTGKDLDTKSIAAALERTEKPDDSILAYYCSYNEDHPGMMCCNCLDNDAIEIFFSSFRTRI